MTKITVSSRIATAAFFLLLSTSCRIMSAQDYCFQDLDQWRKDVVLSCESYFFFDSTLNQNPNYSGRSQIEPIRDISLLICVEEINRLEECESKSKFIPVFDFRQ
jgi:hypothetical protein